MAVKINSTELASIGRTGFVSAKDVLILRRKVFGDGIVGTEDLDLLFKIGERAPIGDREWHQYFCEAAADFYLNQDDQKGHFSSEDFSDLEQRITRDGSAASSLEIELLIKLLETSVSTPKEISTFIAAQMKHLILNKEDGPAIDAKDVEIIRRFIFSAGGDGNIAVTREEAEFLFDLNDAVSKSENDPAWNDLFKKAVSNCLMAHIGRNPQGRHDALEVAAPETKIKSEPSSKPGFIDMILNIFNPKTGHARRVEERHRAANERRAEQAEIAEKITASEAEWLADRISNDEDLHPSEKELVAYMRDKLHADLPPKLKAFIERVA